MKTAPRVVFDTNILFSSIGWFGAPHRSVQAARRRDRISISCCGILDELAEKLISKRHMSLEEADRVVAEIEFFSEVIEVSGIVKAVEKDPDDDLILACAVTGGAEFVVSGDRHLLDLKHFRGIAIVDANEFLRRLEAP